MSASKSALYIVGEQGAFYRSTDAGQTFVEVKTPYQGSYFGLLSLAADKVLLYGLRGNAYWSDNAGQDWHKSETGTLASLTDGLVLNDNTIVLASQAGEVLHSTDHGRSFQSLPVNRPFPFSSMVQARNGDLVVSGVRGVTRVPLSPARVPAR